MANTVECPACSHAWPTRHPVYYVAAQQWWHYDATEVTAVKADDDT